MRGSKIAGRLMALVALLSFILPVSPVGAQSATADQYYAAASKLYAAKNYGQAVRYYLAAVKLNPSHAASYQGLGNCYYAYGRKKEALAYYQRASALQPSNAQLAQFVRSLSAQVSSGASAPGMAAAPSANALGTGMAYFQQKQYAAAIPYFNQAIQQNPNDARAYYYAGYAYYMSRNPRNAAFYFAVANAKQPNPSTKAYADRIKAGLPIADQQWVDAQVSRYTGGTAVAGTSAGTAKKEDVAFGFHLLSGMEYILADPAGIIDAAKNGQSVSLSGVTPNIVMFPELQPYVRLGDSFEINLTIGYFPVGLLSYTTYEFNPNYPLYPGFTGPADVWKYTFNTTVVTADLGAKILFGGKDVRGYLGLSGGISPISMTLTKIQYDSSGNNILPAPGELSGGNYSTMAVSGQALLGVDFSLGKSMSIGPYVGFRYLSASDFKSNGNTLMVDQNSGAVGLPGSPNMPAGDTLEPLKLDFSGIVSGINLTFSF